MTEYDGYGYTQEEAERDLQRTEFGRKMRNLVLSPHWPDLLDYIHSIVEDVDKQVRRLPPGDPTVIAAHAGLHVLDGFQIDFKRGIEDAVDFADHPSDEFKHYVFSVKDATDVAKSMGMENKTY